jgi:hypothetical protein
MIIVKNKKNYYEDIQNLLKTRLRASHVIVFWHVIRFRGQPRPADQCDQTHKNPVFLSTCCWDAAAAKVIQILGEEEGQKLMNNRFQIIHVWKPLGPNPIFNNPLTISDYQSIDAKNDVHSSEVIASENTISLYIVSRKMEDTKKWYYLSNMRSNEMFVFKIFDSNPDVAQFGIHTAFTNTNVPSTDIEQCSIELRCLGFYDQ